MTKCENTKSKNASQRRWTFIFEKDLPIKRVIFYYLKLYKKENKPLPSPLVSWQRLESVGLNAPVLTKSKRQNPVYMGLLCDTEGQHSFVTDGHSFLQL